jgi:hypothetical protein
MTTPALRNIILSVVLLLSGCEAREQKTQRWFKGNLHTHSYWSDGDEYPEMIMDWYKSHGYHFVALSDHNILAQGDKWIKVTKSRMYEEAFEKYLEKFGKDWVTHRMDSGRVNVKLKTYPEYKTLFEDPNFLIIQSEEITDQFNGQPIHMNATNIQALIRPQGGNSVTEVMQRNVDAVLKQRDESGVSMFPHINHPNFHYAVSWQDIVNLRGEQFFEVYNGHPQVHNYGDSLHPGTEEMWDLINTAYVKKGQPLLYGLATDDSHNYHQFGSAYSNAGRGWVMVSADSLSPASLITALENGQFYASTGVRLDYIRFENNTLEVRIIPEENVNFEIQFIGLVNGEERPRVLKKTEGMEASLPLTKENLFVRAKIVSDKPKVNPFQDGEFEAAWTQPVTFRHD